jgi:hypothetical protein
MSSRVFGSRIEDLAVWALMHQRALFSRDLASFVTEVFSRNGCVRVKVRYHCVCAESSTKLLYRLRLLRKESLETLLNLCG